MGASCNSKTASSPYHCGLDARCQATEDISEEVLPRNRSSNVDGYEEQFFPQFQSFYDLKSRCLQATMCGEMEYINDNVRPDIHDEAKEFEGLLESECETPEGQAFGMMFQAQMEQRARECIENTLVNLARGVRLLVCIGDPSASPMQCVVTLVDSPSLNLVITPSDGTWPSEFAVDALGDPLLLNTSEYGHGIFFVVFTDLDERSQDHYHTASSSSDRDNPSCVTLFFEKNRSRLSFAVGMKALQRQCKLLASASAVPADIEEQENKKCDRNLGGGLDMETPTQFSNIHGVRGTWRTKVQSDSSPELHSNELENKMNRNADGEDMKCV